MHLHLIEASDVPQVRANELVTLMLREVSATDPIRRVLLLAEALLSEELPDPKTGWYLLLQHQNHGAAEPFKMAMLAAAKMFEQSVINVLHEHAEARKKQALTSTIAIVHEMKAIVEKQY